MGRNNVRLKNTWLKRPSPVYREIHNEQDSRTIPAYKNHVLCQQRPCKSRVPSCFTACLSPLHVHSCPISLSSNFTTNKTYYMVNKQGIDILGHLFSLIYYIWLSAKKKSIEKSISLEITTANHQVTLSSEHPITLAIEKRRSFKVVFPGEIRVFHILNGVPYLMH